MENVQSYTRSSYNDNRYRIRIARDAKTAWCYDVLAGEPPSDSDPGRVRKTATKAQYPGIFQIPPR